MENSIGKGENAGYYHFFPFLTAFAKALHSAGYRNLGLGSKGLMFNRCYLGGTEVSIFCFLTKIVYMFHYVYAASLDVF